MDLTSDVSEVAFVGSHYKKRLEKLGIKTIKDLLNHVPSRYLDFSLTSKISQVRTGEIVSIKAKIVSIKNQYTRYGKKIQIGQVTDGSGTLAVVWFNQPFLIRILYPKVEVALAGKIDFFGAKKALISPEYEILKDGKAPLHTEGLIPIYPETEGLSSKWLRARIKNLIPSVSENIEEYLPKSILKKFGFLELSEAYENLHSPKSPEMALFARKRLAFDELFLLELKNYLRKASWQKNKSTYKLKVDKKEVKKFIDTLAFDLTNSQKNVIKEMVSDLEKEFPMNSCLLYTSPSPRD